MWRFLLFLPIFLTAHMLTLEEKCGQLLMVHFNGSSANEEAKRILNEASVGGFIYYEWANGLESSEQVKKLSQDLQKLSPKVPLFIAVDQEGGRVTRLKKGFSQPPPNRWLGQQGYPSKAERWAETIGQELKSVGINMNLAPVVDVDSNPKNPVIGDRSFSFEPWEVVRFGQAALKGYRRAKVIAVLKHFPGHGDTSTDSHTGMPAIHKTREELDRIELLPFKRLLPEAEAVMTAHILVSALDPVYCSSLSYKTVTELLRKEFGFEGLILTDSLVMRGVIDECKNADKAAVRAIAAGNDILILGGKLLNGSHEGEELKPDDVIRIHRSLVKAVKEGEISEAQIDRSVERILRVKAKCMR